MVISWCRMTGCIGREWWRLIRGQVKDELGVIDKHRTLLIIDSWFIVCLLLQSLNLTLTISQYLTLYKLTAHLPSSFNKDYNPIILNQLIPFDYQMPPENQDIQLQSLQRFKSTKSPAQQYLQQRINTPYTTHNAYTNYKSLPQLLTLAMFIVQVTLHSVYIAPQIYPINNQILSFIFILNYFIMCVVIGHYLYLTISDPVDSLIVDLGQKETVEKNSKQETLFCVMCQKTVKKTSRHCYDCGRCTEEYDHHCSCLNNCIGLGNYQEFIRLLLFYQIFNALITLQAIWIMSKVQHPNFGACIFFVVLSMVIFIGVVLLLVFHCYLNCVIRKPTFQFLKDRKKIKYEVGDKLEYRNYVGVTLAGMEKEINATRDNKEMREKEFRERVAISK